MKYLGAITDDKDLVNKGYVDAKVPTVYVRSSASDGWDYSSLDLRGLYGINILITPVSIDDVDYNTLQEIKAWATPITNTSTSYYVYPLEVTYIRLSSTNVVIYVKSHHGNPQSTTASYVPQSYIKVQAPFEIASIAITM